MAHTVRGAEQGSEPAGRVGGGVATCGKPTSALGTGLFLVFALGCLHAGLQPLLYFGLCPNVRRAVLEMLGCVPPAEKADSSRTLWEFGLEEEEEEPLPRQNPGEVVPLNQNRNQDQEEEEEEEEVEEEKEGALFQNLEEEREEEAEPDRGNGAAEPGAGGATEPEPRGGGTTEPEPRGGGTTEPEPRGGGTTEPEPRGGISADPGQGCGAAGSPGQR